MFSDCSPLYAHEKYNFTVFLNDNSWWLAKYKFKVIKSYEDHEMSLSRKAGLSSENQN